MRFTMRSKYQNSELAKTKRRGALFPSSSQSFCTFYECGNTIRESSNFSPSVRDAGQEKRIPLYSGEIKEENVEEKNIVENNSSELRRAEFHNEKTLEFITS